MPRHRGDGEFLDKNDLPRNLHTAIYESDYAVTQWSNPDRDLLKNVRIKEFGTPSEKETYIRLNSKDHEALITSSERASISSLIHHKHSVIQGVEVRAKNQDSEPYISAVRGKLPIGCINVKKAPRSLPQLSRVFPQ